MRIVSLIFGILSILGLFIGLIPCLGALNWINIPFAVVGLSVSIIALDKAKKAHAPSTTMELTAVILCAVAIGVGTIRLFIGAGVV